MLGRVLATATGIVVAGALVAAGLGGAPQAQAAAAVDVPCSASALASAMASAGSGATLSLATGCVYVLTAGLPEVSQVLTIAGNGATLERSYAAGTASFTIMTVDSGDLTVDKVNFRHGSGAIAVSDFGQLTVNGGTFTGNSAADGGAIYSDSGPYAPQVNGATFTGNTATGDGGAIYNYSPAVSMVLDQCTFTGNKAADSGGAIWEFGVGGLVSASTFRRNTAGSGGAAWVSEDSGEEFLNTVVQGNVASGDGGGIYAPEGGLGAFFDDSTISGNHAGGRGGGLYASAQSAMASTEVLGNTASDGGGVYNDSGLFIDFTSSTISGNRASADGGGVYGAGEDAEEFFTDSTISGNRAGADGGGVFVGEGGFDQAVLTDSTVSGNRAEVRGGGIYNQSQVAANGTRVVRNAARGGGGGIYDDGPAAMVTLTSSAVAGNTPDNCEPPGSIPGCTG
jgi:predicted outer membrane repeat protein